MQTLEQLQKRLRGALRGGATEIVLAAAETKLLLDELGRLEQSNDRLRRQNRRARLRLQRAGLEGDAVDANDADNAGEPEVV